MKKLFNLFKKKEVVMEVEVVEEEKNPFDSFIEHSEEFSRICTETQDMITKLLEDMDNKTIEVDGQFMTMQEANEEMLRLSKELLENTNKISRNIDVALEVSE